MIIIPAVDVLDHKVVQLVGGELGSQRITLPDPMRAAMSWVDKGAPYLHLVDLDGAFGKGNNTEVFKRIIKECGVPVEVGGGIRSKDIVDDLVSAGADRVIIGTRGIKEPEWLSKIADDHPRKIMAGMDTKNGSLVVNGWRGSSEISVEKMFSEIGKMPLAGVLNTNVSVEGQMKGIDEGQSGQFISKCPHKVIASGGITTEDDCRILNRLGAGGAVVGLAVYTEVIRPWEWDTPWFIR